MKKIIFSIHCLILLVSCAPPTRIVRYEERKNEFYTNPALRSFMKTHDSPKVVLRINELVLRTTNSNASDKNSGYLFNVMESELIKQGFTVKDRSIFNDIISKTYSSDLYKKELADADLIVEVVNIDDKLVYSTRKLTSISRNSSKEKIQPLLYKSLGAYVEYRIVMIQRNELSGIYKLYYQPCAHGCAPEDFKFTGKGRDREVKLPKNLPAETIQHFIATSIRELLISLRES